MPTRPEPTSLDRPFGGPAPAARLLGNGLYRVLLTAAGTGASLCGETALNVWRGDRTTDPDGLFVYLRDLHSGAVWSAGACPASVDGPARAAWRPGVMTLEIEREGLASRVEVIVLPDRPAETRRLTLWNRSSGARRIEVTTFAEVALHHPAAHAAHPAFSRLFLQTAYVAEAGALLVRRRPRGERERHPVLVHALLGGGPVSFETDRGAFLGRGFGPERPRALVSHEPLGEAAGNVLDPALVLRTVVEIPPGRSASVAMVLGAGDDDAAALRIPRSLATHRAIDAAFDAAEAAERARMSALGLDEREAEYAQALGGAVLYGDPRGSAPPPVRMRVATPRSALADLGLRPDRPFVVAHARSGADPGAIEEVARARRYWRALGWGIDLVIVADEARAVPPPLAADEGVTLLDRAALDPPLRDLLDAAAGLVVDGALPDFSTGPDTGSTGADGAAFAATAASTPGDATANGGPRTAVLAPPDAPAGPVADPRARDGGAEETIRIDHGAGGFTAGGMEYAIRLDGGNRLRLPPRPWTNIVAEEDFGFLISETGAGTSWSGNSREHRLTPWSNDAVLDPHDDALYLRDEATGAFWSPTPGPAPLGSAYTTRHGIGYSIFEHRAGSLESAVTVFKPRGVPVRIARVEVANRGTGPRRLAFVSWQRLVLGGIAEETAPFLVTSVDKATGALLAGNRAARDFEGATAFASAVASTDDAVHTLSGDRAAFLGRGGTAAAPRAVAAGGPLDGRVGAGLDPCFARQVVLTIPAGGRAGVAFLLGGAADRGEAVDIVRRFATIAAVGAALDEARAAWTGFVSAVHVETPVPALDLMVNAWLPYQTLSCRIHGRTAFYQSGGAIGFRDQLQDAASLLHHDPRILRRQLLLHAAHQFEEGDVLHWWHPPRARGLRTRFADDLLWLPWLAAFYVEATGDRGVLDERVRYLRARPLEPGEDEAFLLPGDSGASADLYDHCLRAIDRSLPTGRHGLPLFGAGDWNDGMNRVGREGRGESVWMGFFLCRILGDFAPLCAARGDASRAARYAEHRRALAAALDDAGWDGAWYRRGYYDDGTPLGSAANEECRIDALVQAWAVLAGATSPERARRAMDAAEELLVSEQEGLIRLLAPPFEHTPHDPGYIKGYVPGVRENGGQYTHAALWFVRALAELGRRDRAARLLAMLSPVTRTADPAGIAAYQVEPYVVAADVYGAPPHVGRGGWTWYTGSAGWMIRVAVESVLGVSVHGGRELRVKPCIPDDWPEYSMRYRFPGGTTTFTIRVRNPRRRAGRVVAARLDGRPAPVRDGAFAMEVPRDGAAHEIVLELGPEGDGA